LVLLTWKKKVAWETSTKKNIALVVDPSIYLVVDRSIFLSIHPRIHLSLLSLFLLLRFELVPHDDTDDHDERNCRRIGGIRVC